MTSSPCDGLFLYPTSSLEIEDEIAKLDCSKATGPFRIPVKIFKAIKKKVSGPLEVIFNASLLTGIVPRKLKVTKVIPVFKTGSQSCINNYRPISLLSVFDKILEKIVYKRLYLFLQERKILYSKQFGFRNSYSTSYALLSIVDKIKNAIDNHDYACSVFLDLPVSKAFDTMNHDI